MADAIISQLAERLINLLVQQIGDDFDLVRGVEKEVADISTELKIIRNVLEDAERRAFQDQTIKDWLKRLEYASYEVEDVVDEWEYAALQLQVEKMAVAAAGASTSAVVSQQKVCFWIPSPSSCLCFNKVSRRHHVAKKTKELKARLDLIIKEKERYNFVMSQPTDLVGGHGRVSSTSFVEVDDICGRDHDTKILLTKLVVDEGASQGQSGVKIISIVGSGGIGKTTLAQLMYNDSRIVNYYPLRIWICVSNPFNQIAIAKEIVQKVSGCCPNTYQLNSLLEHLRNSIVGKKFLLVLDDVWTENYALWEPFKICLGFGGEGSKILVTTRKEIVAKKMGTTESGMHRLGVLSNDECWLILSRIAFSEMSEKQCEQLEKIGKEIARKCKGLPLAAKALGSLLRFKYTFEQWKNVLDNEIWGFKEVEVELFPHLVLSYNELHPSLKQCFSYLSVFPKDSDLYVREIIRFWLALGYLGADGSPSELELSGQEYFENLSMRSLLQDFMKDFCDEHLLVSGKMHDIVHDFARSLRKSISDGATEKSCQVCSPSLISTIKEYRTLIIEDDCPTYICDCLKSLHVLQFKTIHCMSGMPKGVEKLIHLRYLHLEGYDNVTTTDLMKIFKLYNLKVLNICYTDLKMIPSEIGNLVRLRHLELIGNSYLEELPETICDLLELRSLDVSGSPCGLPLGIYKLTNLKHLHVNSTIIIGEVVEQLTGLRELDGIITMGKLKYLKKLNQLARSLFLVIRLIGEGDVVDDAREAELNKKAHLQQLELEFNAGEYGRIDADDSVWVDILTALRPHQNLASLRILDYGGSKLPDWIVSPLNYLRKIILSNFIHLSQFPELGKLPCLKELIVVKMWQLKFVGREFLGIRTTTEDVGSASNVFGFPKLENLELKCCNEWEEWEDITVEGEHSTTISFFPCLKKFELIGCPKLKALPHCLWRKVITSSKNLVIEFKNSPIAVEDYNMNILAGLNPGEGFESRIW